MTRLGAHRQVPNEGLEIAANFEKHGLAYDVGMHNGDDSAYYLEKGYTVVGIDANPDMCRNCEVRFRREIDQGLMRIVNLGVSDVLGQSTFYVNKSKPAISTFEPGRFESQRWAPCDWEPVQVPTVPLSSIIAEYGRPEFVKVDVEFYDGKVLLDLLLRGIRPKYISAEAHEIDTYCLLVALGYERFKIVSGASVEQRYKNLDITRLDGTTFRYSFPFASSGPFGTDLPEPELDKMRALTELMRHGLGWVDMHGLS